MHQAERTCIGCRSAKEKHELVRVVAGPNGLLIDYREKLPGRAAYVCPTGGCIKKAMSAAVLSRAFRSQIAAPRADDFIKLLAGMVRGKIQSLLAIARKANMTAAGYSAVKDALDKKRVSLLLFAEDLAEGTREKIEAQRTDMPPRETLFKRDEYGSLFNRELIGVAGILDAGLANAILHEVRRLKSLLNNGN
ncbi:MAG TPA: DUF448 domain-containing protein [Nitrospirota bacterium]|nr:DUF448 domain-containing protein [Nitrospirota bacterium]